MAKITMLTFERLSKRLGALDKERREILKQLKSTPEFGVKHLNEMLIKFTNQNEAKWFYRTGEASGTSYWKMIGFKISEVKPTITKPKKALIVEVIIDWDVYSSSGEKRTVNEVHKISAFNEVEGQILNGRKLATAKDEKKLVKLVLTEKKNKLEAELKGIKDELVKLK